MKFINTKFVSSAALLVSTMISGMTCSANSPASFMANQATTNGNVVTYHGDPQRTGWNANETILTPSSVATGFGLIAKIPLDAQVDTQPLLVLNQSIANQGIHNVVYVTTENNTVYAIDANTGSILIQRSLGNAASAPFFCAANGPKIGVNGTPTIDTTTNTLYAIAYVNVNGVPTYQLHAIDLGTLADKPNSPVNIQASQTLANGSTFKFNATHQRQRPALLQTNGNIYAGFGSFCDLSGDKTRGWVLGWNATSLSPLASNELTNTITTNNQYYFASLWMSGYGLATDNTTGDVFFVTGNSDPNTPTYTGTTNIQESVVRMHGSLSGIAGIFTPANYFHLDQNDQDFGSGGVMVLPDQPGTIPHIAVAAGKDGRMFVIDRDNMGGYKSPDVPQNVQIGGCWCGPSYFAGSDGVGRVVSSGNKYLITWKVTTNPKQILKYEANATINFSQDGSFFTSVSSNGTVANSAIIWAVSKPDDAGNITLYAFNGTAANGKLNQLWSGIAGIWNSPDANANIVPTVANGHAYVASDHTLTIFGLVSGQSSATKKGIAVAGIKQSATKKLSSVKSIPGFQYTGTILSINGSTISLKLEDGQILPVDIKPALATHSSVVPVVGRNVLVTGSTNTNGGFEASNMVRLKALSAATKK